MQDNAIRYSSIQYNNKKFNTTDSFGNAPKKFVAAKTSYREEKKRSEIIFGLRI